MNRQRKDSRINCCYSSASVLLALLPPQNPSRGNFLEPVLPPPAARSFWLRPPTRGEPEPN